MSRKRRSEAEIGALEVRRITSRVFEVYNPMTNHIYRVWEENGEFKCTCPGYQFHRSKMEKGWMCKHIRAVLSFLEKGSVEKEG